MDGQNTNETSAIGSAGRSKSVDCWCRHRMEHCRHGALVAAYLTLNRVQQPASYLDADMTRR
jgi:hypothetical protein